MKQPNWIVTSGKAEVKANTIKYTSDTFKNQLGNEEILASIVKSNVTFDNGEINFKVVSKDQFGRCQVLLNYDEGQMVLIGLNVVNGLYGIVKYNRTTNNFDPLSVTGLSDTFQTKAEYNLRVKITGSIIELFVNDVLVASAYEQITQSQVAFFFSSKDEIVVKVPSLHNY